MEQNNKKFYIIIAALVGVVTFLIGLIVGMFINLRLPAKSGGGQPEVVAQPDPPEAVVNPSEGTGESVLPTSQPDEPNAGGKEEIKPTVAKKDGAIELCYSGYQFMIPEDYGVLFEDYGPVVHMNGIFQLRLVVKEESAADFKAHESNLAGLTEKAVQNGWEITKECKKYTIDGKDYYIFGGRAEGDDYLVFRTQIDDKNIFAGNMAVFDSSIKDEDYYNIFAGLAKTITKTDKPDTTSDEFNGVKYTVNIGEEISEKEIKSSHFDVIYKVPSAFYLTDTFSFEEDGMADYNDSYMTNKYDMVDVKITTSSVGAKAYIADEGRYINCEHKSFDKNGHTFYYAIREGKPDDFFIQSILVATDLKEDGWIYVVDIYNDAEKYSLDDLAEFFDITEK